ncbi:MAG: TRAP transporter substrate-binding protein DctP [Verrucomicrobia bacterium]|nr:TRAP transporter substrate-binding protein DctP [Verrucomicrobiota bacterium]
MKNNVSRNLLRCFPGILMLCVGCLLNAASIKVATIAPRGTSFHNHLEELNAQWSHAPGEPVRMNIYAGTQGGEVAIVKRMRINQLQGAMLSAIGLSQIDESVTALQLMPMQFRSWEEVDYVRSGLEEKMENLFLQKGYIVLFWGDAGWARFFSKKPIIEITDLKSMRIGDSPGSPKATELLKNYYTPVIMDPSKTLLALKNGMIEAVPLPPFLANATQLSTETKYMLDMKWVPVIGAMVLTKRAWDRLPAETQVYLKETSRAMGKKVRQTSRQEDEDSIKAMVEKQGLIVNRLPESSYAGWMKEVDKNQPKIRGNVVPADIYDLVMEKLKEFRAKAPAP